MTTTTLTSGGASDSLSLSNGDDGTLTVKVGPTGAKVNALVFDAAGTPTFIKQPVTPVQSMVRLNAANGYGSTNTKIRRFANVVTNQGSDITYSDSATLGAAFTLNASGVYAVSYSDNLNTAGNIGISLNTTAPTTSILGLPISEILAIATPGSPNWSGPTSWTGYLAASSIVRAHLDGSLSGSGPCVFTITRVA